LEQYRGEAIFGDGVGLPDVFEAAVEGLYEPEFEWMLLAGVLKMR
jgi:hypothetical protein